jgi:carbohydrate ABC transporter membrane protein 2, CUT1 family (TC 3.A.1.1.-)
MKQKGNKKITNVLLWIILILVAVIQVFPLVWLTDFSLASSNEMFTSGLLIIPEKIQWGNYVKAFIDGHFLLYLKNKCPDQRAGSDSGNPDIYYGGLCLQAYVLEVKSSGKDASSDGNDDTDPCDSSAKL